jgi:hypothetical protein
MGKWFSMARHLASSKARAPAGKGRRRNVRTVGHGPAEKAAAARIGSYGDRYCAFVDILGFAELTRKGSMPFSSIRELLRIVHAAPRGHYITLFKGSDLKAQSISDALCLSAANSPAGLAHLMYNLEALVLRLLEEGFFVRGAIVKGQLYHDSQMAFGEALVRAYRLEQDVARYPRVMITSGVAKDIIAFIERRRLSSLFVDTVWQADDGPYYLHVLDLIEAHLTNVSECQLHIMRYNRMARQIQRRLDETLDNPKHFEKVQWFAEYWNRTIERHSTSVEKITGPGVSTA